MRRCVSVRLPVNVRVYLRRSAWLNANPVPKPPVTRCREQSQRAPAPRPATFWPRFGYYPHGTRQSLTYGPGSSPPPSSSSSASPALPPPNTYTPFKTPLPNTFSSPTVSADCAVYAVGDDDGSVTSFHANGTARWVFTTQGAAELFNTPVVGPDGTVHVIGSNGVLFALRHDGVLAWTWAEAS